MHRLKHRVRILDMLLPGGKRGAIARFGTGIKGIIAISQSLKG